MIHNQLTSIASPRSNHTCTRAHMTCQEEPFFSSFLPFFLILSILSGLDTLHSTHHRAMRLTTSGWVATVSLSLKQPSSDECKYACNKRTADNQRKEKKRGGGSGTHLCYSHVAKNVEHLAQPERLQLQLLNSFVCVVPKPNTKEGKKG